MKTSMNLESKIDKGPRVGVRHQQFLLLFFNKIIVFMLQVHVTVTIVAMTNADQSNPAFKEYKWTNKQKSYIISSLFFGQLITQLPGSLWIRRFGVKKMFFIITLCAGIFNGLIPLTVTWGDWQIFCLLRFVQGLFLALENSASMQHLANWCPPEERNRFGGIIITGMQCGIFSASLLSGAISQSSLGWPSVFYITSSLSFLWSILWAIFGADNINKSKFITQKERAYIQSSLSHCLEFNKQKLPIPWQAIFKSLPFWSLVIVRAIEIACFYTIQTEFPAYMNGVFKLNIAENALYSALPFISSFFLTYVFIAIADFIGRRQLLTTTTSRKCFNSIGMWIPATGILCIGFLNEQHKILTILINTATTSMGSAVIFGGFLACIDIAPNHTEIVMTIVSLFSRIFIFLGPVFGAVIVEDEANRFQWRILFATIAALYCVADLVFLIWGSCEVQPWNAADYLENHRKIQGFQTKYTKREDDDIFTITKTYL